MDHLEKRIELWNQIKRIPDGEVEYPVTEKLGIYKGPAGICIGNSGLTISVLSVGKHPRYSDKVFKNGIYYDYPKRAKMPSQDQEEIEATKKCQCLNIPIFVLLPGIRIGTNTVKLGRVAQFSDETEVFYIHYLS